MVLKNACGSFKSNSYVSGAVEHHGHKSSSFRRDSAGSSSSGSEMCNKFEGECFIVANIATEHVIVLILMLY